MSLKDGAGGSGCAGRVAEEEARRERIERAERDLYAAFRAQWRLLRDEIVRAMANEIRQLAEAFAAMGRWTQEHPLPAAAATYGAGAAVLAVALRGESGWWVLLLTGVGAIAAAWAVTRSSNSEEEELGLEEREARADFALWQVDPWLALEAGADPEEMLRREREEERRREQQEKLQRFARAVSGKPAKPRSKPDGPAPETPPGQGEPPRGGTGLIQRKTNLTNEPDPAATPPQADVGGSATGKPQRRKNRYVVEEDGLARVACVLCGTRTTVPKRSPHKCRECVDWQALSDREKRLVDTDGRYLYPPPVDTGTMKRTWGRHVAGPRDPLWSDGSPVALVPWARGRYRWSVQRAGGLYEPEDADEVLWVLRERPEASDGGVRMEVRWQQAGRERVMEVWGVSGATAQLVQGPGWQVMVVARDDERQRAPMPDGPVRELQVKYVDVTNLLPPEPPKNTVERSWA